MMEAKVPRGGMRAQTLVGLILLAGCKGQDVVRENPSLPPVYFTLTGGVFDSVLNTPVAGLRISIGDSSVLTNDAGLFHTTQRAGSGQLTINDRRFERVTLPANFDHNANLTLLLKGTAPYASRCEFRGDTVTALIMDLQGRKTMDRRFRTYLTAELNQQLIQKNGYAWFWTPLDNITWSAAVLLPDTTISSVSWQLEDLDGNARTSTCQRSPVCAQCQGPQ